MDDQNRPQQNFPIQEEVGSSNGASPPPLAPQSPLSGMTIDLPQVVQEPPAPPPQDTYIVPAAETVLPAPQTGLSAKENPFIPQGGPQVSSPASPHERSFLVRRLLMIVVFLLLAGAVFAGARFVLGLLSGAKEVTISYWGLWENESIIQPVIAAFESAHPKIKVDYVKQSPKQFRERLQASIARGDGPDVFRFHNTWVPMLKNELSLVPKTVTTAEDFSKSFYPIVADSLMAGSSIYGIPIEIDGLGLYTNDDLFAAAGVKVPTTWEDVLSIVPQLTVKNADIITTSAISLGTWGNIEAASDILAVMMLQNGANLAKPTGKEAEETLIFYRKFATPSDPVYTWNDTLDNSVYAFATEKVAMILAPSWRALDIREINPKLRFHISPIPQLPGTTVTWASFWVEGVSSKSREPEAAWEFVKYLTSKEGAIKLYTEASKTRLFGEPYARVELGNTMLEDPYVGAYIAQAKNARTFPLASRTFDNGLNDKLIKYLEDAVNGTIAGSAPSAVLQTLASGFQQILSQYGLVSTSVPAEH